MIGLILVLLSLGAGAGLFYWLIIHTEGAYLGPRVVAFLYDRGAGTYDQVKQFDAVEDAWHLAIPLHRALKDVSRPLVLDVATGTGRLPVALLRHLDFEGLIVGLDISLQMLREARRKTMAHGGTVTFLWKDALALPFDDEVFDGVACLEALEFLADPCQALREMARVLRPGGSLLITNRIGLDALFMPGRAFSRRLLQEILASLGLTSIEIKTWQTYYDLVWARRQGSVPLRGSSEGLREILRCPHCAYFPLLWEPAELSCQGCGLSYAVLDGIICLERPVDGRVRRSH
jgi:ubiquinone/menaquinone biosynthesis C-methylase UbiE